MNPRGSAGLKKDALWLKVIKDDIQGQHILSINLIQDYPSKFFSALQSYCSRLSIVFLSCDSKLTLIQLDLRKKFGRVEQEQSELEREKEDCPQFKAEDLVPSAIHK